ncbi:DsrE family protein [Pelomicrobium sp.]|jgi:predicted peroxiredoxin|uniref:DsrE family protein n=1 Tax=Pelomicrobium sp. TaxID=2815319 RepID=UPI002FDD7410
MKFLIAVSSGTDDPTRATLGVMAAKTAREQGHEVTVWLQGEAVVIANRHVYDKIQGVNMPAMQGLMEALLAQGVPFWVCEACGKGRNVTPENWVATASYRTMGDYVAAAAAADRVLSF